MAKAAGITMMDSRLLEENGRAHFMTRRFDRADGDIRHHIQTLCAMRGPTSNWTRRHLMSVNGKFDNFTEEDLLAVADRFAIGTGRRVIQQVRKTIKSWGTYAAKARIGTQQMRSIEELLLLS